ncbi:short-chain dehydrogenases/reductases family protein [Legionella busanensis]|uniref:Short-chain dehydrogenases/reductases family protein n=1 Tax=Legionella busanensis TaxID=190655 RepID=A0A378JJU8_9GAMM|nr:SDR family oxidoreductase [Legionella busanensis]STX50968.1 short-chain dehydrogenases/reductases family protein [Legionella busanensis]
MPINISGKNIIVTGGNNGLGKAIAQEFAKNGANVLITYHSDKESANETVEELKKYNIKTMAIQVDLTSPVSRDYLVEESYRFFQGSVDIVVNNAGTLTRQPILQLSPQEIENVFALNFFAPFYLTQAFGKRMVVQQQSLMASGETELKDYCIINISSISRKVVVPGLAHYEASKAALSQFTKSAAVDKDFCKNNIRVNDIAPGLVPTNLNASLWKNNSLFWKGLVKSIPLNRPGKPQEIAAAVLSVATNPWMTGSTITIDGGRAHNWFGSEINNSSGPDNLEPDLPSSKL